MSQADRSSGRESLDLLMDEMRLLRDRASAFAEACSVSWYYNPLTYAWDNFAQYLQTYAVGRKRVLFLGMNPGPWGMTQTGVPFGEIAAVRDWMGLNGRIDRPVREHPKRPIQGYSCPRCEVSGRRLWSLMQDRFGSAEVFFSDHLVMNYCPLVFMGETGKNITPDHLPVQERELLDEICTESLVKVIRLIEPEWLVGVGVYAQKKFDEASQRLSGDHRVTSILHPSPASPAANRGWSEAASNRLMEMGIW